MGKTVNSSGKLGFITRPLLKLSGLRDVQMTRRMAAMPILRS
jgi:hypothetical protein